MKSCCSSTLSWGSNLKWILTRNSIFWFEINLLLSTTCWCNRVKICRLCSSYVLYYVMIDIAYCCHSTGRWPTCLHILKYKWIVTISHILFLYLTLSKTLYYHWIWSTFNMKSRLACHIKISVQIYMGPNIEVVRSFHQLFVLIDKNFINCNLCCI